MLSRGHIPSSLLVLSLGCSPFGHHFSFLTCCGWMFPGLAQKHRRRVTFLAFGCCGSPTRPCPTSKIPTAQTRSNVIKRYQHTKYDTVWSELVSPWLYCPVYHYYLPGTAHPDEILPCTAIRYTPRTRIDIVPRIIRARYHDILVFGEESAGTKALAIGLFGNSVGEYVNITSRIVYYGSVRIRAGPLD
ncbi:unnamed protein product [Laminaria digitata]